MTQTQTRFTALSKETQQKVLTAWTVDFESYNMDAIYVDKFLRPFVYSQGGQSYIGRVNKSNLICGGFHTDPKH